MIEPVGDLLELRSVGFAPILEVVQDGDQRGSPLLEIPAPARQIQVFDELGGLLLDVAGLLAVTALEKPPDDVFVRVAHPLALV